MTEEIKNRIEQIKAGQVPEGYRTLGGYCIPIRWNIKRLEDCFSRLTRKNKKDNQNVLTISAQQGLISQLDYYNNSYASEDKRGYSLLFRGDFAYNKSYSTDYSYGVIKRLEKCEKGIVSPLYLCFAPKGATATDFFVQYFEAGVFNREIYKIAQEGARNHGLLNVAVDDFFASSILYPPLPEQHKIAEILTQCDRVIELKQSKIEELQKLKKACLSKMFPKEGYNVPELRFPGFTDAWEQRKLSELADFSKGQGYTKSDLRESGTPIILYGRLYTKYQPIIRAVDTFADIVPGAVFSKGGEVILPSSGETAEDIAIASSIDKSGFLLGGGLNIVLPHEELQSAFLAIELSFGAPHNALAKRAQGKSVVHLYNEDLKEVSISYPTADEQVKISSYFDHLDNLITLHQRELKENLKYKRALMQLLLTGIVRATV